MKHYCHKIFSSEAIDYIFLAAYAEMMHIDYFIIMSIINTDYKIIIF